MRLLLARCALAVLLAGCGRPEVASPADVDLDAALGSWAPEQTGSPGTVRIARSDPRSLRAPVRIGHERRPRQRIGRPVDARFEGAPLASALRLLADAANVGLVVGEGVGGTVSLDLRGVPPLEAMQVLAEAHRVDLTFVGRTVIARGR